MLYFDAFITTAQRLSGVPRVGRKYLNSSRAKLQQLQLVFQILIICKYNQRNNLITVLL